ncbi:MAG: heparan N-sulfatase, partial [Verrucomicrobiota bacterium]
QYRKSMSAPYGQKTVDQYIHRPEFELYNIQKDPDETTNLAGDPQAAEVLREYQKKLKGFQKKLDDPWIMKWDYE